MLDLSRNLQPTQNYIMSTHILLSVFGEPCIRASHKEGKFRCPECQAQIDLPDGNRFDSLQTSFFHNSLLSLLAVRRTGDGSNMTCSQCRKTTLRIALTVDGLRAQTVTTHTKCYAHRSKDTKSRQ